MTKIHSLISARNVKAGLKAYGGSGLGSLSPEFWLTICVLICWALGQRVPITHLLVLSLSTYWEVPSRCSPLALMTCLCPCLVLAAFLMTREFFISGSHDQDSVYQDYCLVHLCWASTASRTECPLHLPFPDTAQLSTPLLSQSLTPCSTLTTWCTRQHRLPVTWRCLLYQEDL